MARENAIHVQRDAAIVAYPFVLRQKGRVSERYYPARLCQQLQERIEAEIGKKGLAQSGCKNAIVQNNAVVASMKSLIEKDNVAIDKKNAMIDDANTKLLALQECGAISQVEVQRRWREPAPRILGKGSYCFAQWFKKRMGL